ncbi:hypothetical protein E6C76_20280 [Pseudothauera nasutitermitis]|uniref:Uncharacterized protein n=1 Tax=Pseudothauera nasutitermitis TaxID=2565930 RepID=A0A4S4AP39_9RHOO|nr:hypothetical protein [Pseudothauera nasutitermitis]THF61421.1 hypothetical protein E6C76_20280 [Pseudothauera nasutitermitis]
MDDKEIRVAMLRQLINDQFGGVALRLAIALDMKPPQLHRWLSERQGVSAESARAIEMKLGLARGWLDRLSDLPPSEGQGERLPTTAVDHSDEPALCLPRKAPTPSRNPEVSRALFDLAHELERGDLTDEARKLLTAELQAKTRFVREALDRLKKKDK